VALLLCLLFLTALALLGLSASADAVLQNQLAANHHDAQMARQSALSALSWAEQWLTGLEDPSPDKCTIDCDGLKIYSPGDLPARAEFSDPAWWDLHGHEAGIDPLTGERNATIVRGSARPSIFIIVKAHELPTQTAETPVSQTWYRILARGSGRSESAVSVVESMVWRTWVSDGHKDSPDGARAGSCHDPDQSPRCGRVSWRQLR
jgi:Tfp pilus assembly protein PilX